MNQMLDFLPFSVKNALSYLNMNLVYELRLRADQAVRVNYGGNYSLLGERGLVSRSQDAIVVQADEIAETVFVAGKYSVYSVEEQLRRGFITAEHGERIGLAGEFVFEKGQALTTKNFTSLCIRVPHEIRGSGEEIFRKCLSDGLKNLLVCSPPGQGKTTILRDLTRILSEKTQKNVLVCDERGEIAVGELGGTVDAYLYADKATAFECGVRAMRPDIIVCDELSALDCKAVQYAVNGGVKVIASAHIERIAGIVAPFLGTFERFAFLSPQVIGRVDGIYDERLRLV